MVTPTRQRRGPAIVIAGLMAGSAGGYAPAVSAAGFIDDSTLSGGLYYWQRERDRKDLSPTKTVTQPDGSVTTINNPDYDRYATNL